MDLILRIKLTVADSVIDPIVYFIVYPTAKETCFGRGHTNCRIYLLSDKINGDLG